MFMESRDMEILLQEWKKLKEEIGYKGGGRNSGWSREGTVSRLIRTFFPKEYILS